MNAKNIIANCCICGGVCRTVYELPFEDIIGMDHDYVQMVGICEKCGYIFTQNPFSTEKLENRYRNESKFEFDSEDHIQGENEEYVTRCKRVQHFLQACIKGFDSILEVGAASGYNLSLYNCRKKMGIEPSALNCRLAHKNYQVKMFNGSFREYLKHDYKDKYDVIFLSMILEHIVNPFAFLSQLKEINTKYMFIEVPAFDIKNIDEPFGMFCEEHVNMFTFEALNNMMKALGYGLVDAKIEMGFDKGYPAGWPCMDTIWELGRIPIKFKPILSSSMILNEYIKKSAGALEQIKQIIKRIPESEKLAIWGTGHHVSMLLKNTDLGKKNIVKFFDSDKKKYSYKMHGKNIGRFCEEECKGIDTILIGSYIFQEQIEKTINQSNILNNCRIITLYDK